MKTRVACLVLGFLSLVVSLVLPTVAQSVAQSPAQAASGMPRLVRFGGSVKDVSGSPLTGAVAITFALYSEQTGGAALWLETQNITADSNGHYRVLLGSTKVGLRNMILQPEVVEQRFRAVVLSHHD